MGLVVKERSYILKVKKLEEFIHEPKKWRKKCVNDDDKKLRQEYEYHEIYDKIAYLLKNMILVVFKV